MKKKPQFSKLHVIFADALVAVVNISYFVLLFMEKPFVPDIAVATINIYGAFATGGYFTLCAVRDCSLNKHGINKEEFSHENQLETEANQP